MSRTYRRRRGDTTWKDWHRELPYYSRQFKDFQHFEARYHSDAHRNMSTPSWWINMAMTVRQRQEVRRLVHQVMRLIDLEDAPLFPLAKKPHIYYW